METPAEVMVHCDLMGLKGARGRLLQISESGYYEVNLSFGDRVHRTLLPVGRTVIIGAEQEESSETAPDVER